jgi:hypothetical protein
VRRRRPKALAVALRRGWVVLAAVAAVTALAVAIDRARTGRTVAQTVVVVPSGAGAKGPGNATESIKLAQTYVEAIPLDGGVLSYVARTIGQPIPDVADAITVVGNPTTSVLLLRYTDSNHDRALAAASALLGAVVGARPHAHSVAPHSLATVRAPSVLSESAGRSSTAIPIGVILGLCLGLVLIVAWERSDPRIDGPRELAHAAGTPATALGDVAPGNIDALLERWRRLAGDEQGPHVVGLVAGTRRTERLVGPAANELVALSETNGHALRLATAPPPATGGERGLVVRTGGRPGGPAAGEAVASDASVVVVVVEPGARVTELRSTLAVLDEFGAPPRWALLARRGGAPPERA